MTPTMEDDLLVDTSKMSEGKRQALEVTEAAREKKWAHPSFVRELFMGSFCPEILHPFPEQNDKEAQIGDDIVMQVAEYMKKNLDPEEVEATRTVPQNVIKDFAKMGLFAMKIPKEYGGLALSQVNYNRVMKLIASYCGSTAVLLSAHQSIGVPQPLKAFGTEEQKRKYLPRFAEGAISAFALTEIDVGSDPAQMTTEAYPSPDGKYYIINGKKLWCTNGPIADILIVMAKTPPKMVNGKEKKQITAFIVERNTPGIEVLQRCEFMGLAAIQNGLLKFTNVKVPVENMLGKEGKGLSIALSTLNVGRLTLPGACAGMAAQCLSIARRWGNKRSQWGMPIGYHEAGREKIAYISSSLHAIEAVTWLTSHWADKGDVDIRIEAAMAKLFCTEVMWKIADMTLQLRGGRGYEKASSLKARGEDPFPVERMMRDARINTIIEGTSEIMRLFLAREVLDAHLQKAAPLLKRNSSSGEKIKTSWDLLKFYGVWYPSQWVNLSRWSSYREMGDLEGHFNFIAKTSHKLARTLFHLIAKYKDRLEERQMLLFNIVEIGTELFAIAASCSYAIYLQEKRTYDTSPIQLADHFCKLSRQRIKQHFESLKKPQHHSANALAETVLKGSMKWLEEDIMHIGKPE